MAEWLTNLGDAIAGVDADDAFMEGEIERSEVDQRRAATDASFALAKQRQQDAMIAQKTREIQDQIATMDAEALAQNIGLITAGDFGSSYAGAQLGGNRYQENELRARMADPATAELDRTAAASALAPGSYLSNIGDEPDSEPLVVVQNADGSVSYVPRSQAAGATPGARPSSSSAAGGRPPANVQNIDDLVRRGYPENLAVSLVYNADRDPRVVHAQIYRDLLRNYSYDAEDAMQMADDYVTDVYGADSMDLVRSQLGGFDEPPAPAPARGRAGAYASPEEVAEAIDAGELTEDQAKQILIDEFGFEE